MLPVAVSSEVWFEQRRVCTVPEQNDGEGCRKRLHGDCLCSREQLGWCEDSLDYAPFIATELFDEALINKYDVYGFCFVKEDECPKESFPLNQ